MEPFPGGIWSFYFLNTNAFALLKLEINEQITHLSPDSLSQNFTKNEELRNFYNVLTTNTNDQVEFISTMEGRERNFLCKL